nr:(2Fe-2S)-binding protein [Mycolicibacterium hippocampi]
MGEAIAAGASTTKQVGEATGAGTVCGRCRGSIRALIAAARQQAAPLG